MQETKAEKTRYELTSPGLPLAVYREVVAHLRQVLGVDAGLILYEVEPNQTEPQTFDYAQSQVKGLWWKYARELDEKDKQCLQTILDYYAQRYRPWDTSKT